VLVKNYKDNIGMEDAINLGVSIIKKINEGKLSESNVDISTIKKDVGFESFTTEKVAKYL